MAIPNLKDFILYVNKALDSKAWNTNWQKVVNLFTSGQADVKFKSVEISQDGGLVNNGSFTQNGNLTVGGNAEITGNLQVNGTLSGDGSGLTGVISSAQISYTPFCVNSGNLDVNGFGDLFITDGVQTSIQFKVGDGTTYKPITFTNAKGKTTTLNAINSYSLSQTDNGTYIVYIEENSTAVTLSDNGRTIFRQPFAPTVEQNPQPSDIWLDTSSEGLKSYIRQSGTWEEANIVPLGEVTVANHELSSAKTYAYNQNGYDINTNTKIFGVTEQILNSLVSGTKDTVYRDAHYPTFVLCGAKDDSQPYDWDFKLQVSVDNSTWKTVTSGVNIDGGYIFQVVIGAGLYWKYTTTLSSNDYVEYAQIKGV
ncbi:MAG: hypothetical protein J6S85_11255 [Methanobrevibacter sp.]|nr:hypothetical protein [Methanobrevibacter sp.]